MARTRITNTSGAKRHFGYLPPHGMDLDDAESIEFDGDLRTVLASGLGRYTRRREIAALDQDVITGRAEVEEIAELTGSSSSSP